MIAIANFVKSEISPGFILNFRKSHRISKNYLESFKSYGQKPLGVSIKTTLAKGWFANGLVLMQDLKHRLWPIQ